MRTGNIRNTFLFVLLVAFLPLTTRAERVNVLRPPTSSNENLPLPADGEFKKVTLPVSHKSKGESTQKVVKMKAETAKPKAQLLDQLDQPELIILGVPHVTNSVLNLKDPENPPKSAFAFGLSSWAPSHLDRPSYLNQTSTFAPQALPEIQIAFQKYLNTEAQAGLKWEFALSYLKMVRTGTSGLGGFAPEQTQELNILNTKLGLIKEFSYSLLSSQLHPVLAGGLGALLAQSAKGPFDEGARDSLFNLDLRLGLNYKSASWGLLVGAMSRRGLANRDYNGEAAFVSVLSEFH